MSTILGFIFGIIACWIFWKYLLWQKPNVEIADKVAFSKSKQSGRNIFRFKIHNNGNNQVIGITFKAWVCDLIEVPGGQISRGMFQFPINNSETLTLAQKAYNDRPWGLTPESNFCSEPDFDVEELLNEPNRRILVTLRATDAISDTTVVQQKTYTKKDIIRGKFGFGESLDIIPDANVKEL